MKLYDANSGNAKRVRIFIVEKGIDIKREVIELGKDTRSSEFLKLNSLGEVPVLQLEDGQVITESNAICNYLEARFPNTSLMGVTPEEKGNVDMWSWRVYSQIFLTVGLMVRHQLPLFKDVLEQVPAFAEAQRKAIPDRWRWLDQEMSDGRTFIAGNAFSYADVQGMTALTITDIFDLSPPEDCVYIKKWAQSMRERPSWTA
ncbi:glutathione S-transferase family protein [Marinicella sp. W31]|uniref:glutathione S-transferase family protein n=1 Tax=Marinicella sp. W31 TaxID=3023713 RepID=UPI00375809F4